MAGGDRDSTLAPVAGKANGSDSVAMEVGGIDGAAAEDRGQALPAPRSGPGFRGAPAVALFVGGFLTCLGLVLCALVLTGTIRPMTSGTAAAFPSAVASSGASPTSAASPRPMSPGPGATALGTLTPIVSPSLRTPTDLASGYTLGKPSAGVTVEVWEDFQCPYCRRFTEQVEPHIVATYVETGRVRLVYRDFAFLGDESAWAAVAADLAEQQGEFWPYHDYLFANQLGENVGSFTVARLEAIASAVGLDRATFDAGMTAEAASATYAKIQQAEQADATTLAISGTPTVVVQGKALAGNDWATVKAAIDAALAPKPSQPPA